MLFLLFVDVESYEYESVYYLCIICAYLYMNLNVLFEKIKKFFLD